MKTYISCLLIVAAALQTAHASEKKPLNAEQRRLMREIGMSIRGIKPSTDELRRAQEREVIKQEKLAAIRVFFESMSLGKSLKEYERAKQKVAELADNMGVNIRTPQNQTLVIQQSMRQRAHTLPHVSFAPSTLVARNMSHGIQAAQPSKKSWFKKPVSPVSSDSSDTDSSDSDA